MNSTDFFWALGDLFQMTFTIFEFIGNKLNYLLIVFGFGGFFYWMNLQRKFNAEANVPVEIKDNEGWYKNPEGKKLK
jgi:hypothetical protein